MLIGLLPLAQQVYADKADEYLARTMAEAAKFRNTPKDVLHPGDPLLHSHSAHGLDAAAAGGRAGVGAGAGGAGDSGTNPLSLIRDRMRDQIKGTSSAMSENCAGKWIAQQKQQQQQQRVQQQQWQQQQQQQQLQQQKHLC